MKNKLRIYHIGDTHGNHDLLKVPSNIDMIIHSGDESNYLNPYKNEPETRDFLEWYGNLDIKYKVFVAGNHSTAICKNLITRKEIEEKGIIYLENEEVVIEGYKIWGSPFSPTFGNWAFMKSRNTINRLWDNIPDDTDILITHSPPQGVLDLTYHGVELKQVGCSALMKRVMKIKPKLHLFGHIHNTQEGLQNAGTTRLSTLPETLFSNGSVVTDGRFGILTSNGNVIEL